MNLRNASYQPWHSRKLHCHWRALVVRSIVGILACLGIIGCMSQLPIEQHSPNISSWQPTETDSIPSQTLVKSTPAHPTASPIPLATETPEFLLPTSTSLATATLPTPTPSPVPYESALTPFPEQELATILNNVPGTFGVFVYDEQAAAVVYKQNADMSFYAASLIKLPIALTLYSMAHQGEIDLDEQLTMQAQDIVPGTGSLQYEGVGTSYTLRELCTKMISTSDNTASNMLLTRIGFDRVNSLMYQLGATQTFVERLFFDEDARLAGHDIRTSPRDMSLLLQTILDGEIIGEEGAIELMVAMEQNFDRQKIPALLPPDVIVMNKSGVIEGVEHDAGIVSMPNGHRYIVVIMSTELADNRAGIDAIAQVSRIIFDYEQALDL